MACMHGTVISTVMKFTSCQFRFRNNGQNPTRIYGEIGSQCFELILLIVCTITCLLWQSEDARMHKTTQILELRFFHLKLTRIGGCLGTRQTPMKAQGILLEGTILIERFLRNPYASVPRIVAALQLVCRSFSLSHGLPVHGPILRPSCRLRASTPFSQDRSKSRVAPSRLLLSLQGDFDTSAVCRRSFSYSRIAEVRSSLLVPVCSHVPVIVLR